MAEFAVELERDIKMRQWAVVYIEAATPQAAQLKAIEMSDGDIEWHDGEMTDWSDKYVTAVD